MSGAAPLVSVVIACRDHARFLGEAIESALSQTHRPVEVVVVDDGSVDDSAKVAESFAARGVRLRRQPNAGLSAARNAGARLAAGAYVVFLDADDALETTYVEECLAALSREPGAGFAYTQMRFFGSAEGVTAFPPYSVPRLLDDNYIHASALLRAELVRGGPYREDFKTGWEDWDFYLTLAERGVGGVRVDRPLLRYRKHAEATSMLDAVGRRRLLQLRMRLAIIAAHPALFPRGARLRALARWVKDSF